MADHYVLINRVDIASISICGRMLSSDVQGLRTHTKASLEIRHKAGEALQPGLDSILPDFLTHALEYCAKVLQDFASDTGSHSEGLQEMLKKHYTANSRKSNRHT
jgi:hypothetical protein